MFDTYAKAAKEFGVESFGNVEVDALDDLDDGATDYYPSKVSVNFCRNGRNKNNVDFNRGLCQAALASCYSAARYVGSCAYSNSPRENSATWFVYVVTSSAYEKLILKGKGRKGSKALKAVLNTFMSRGPTV